jgi:immunity protein 70 of polymorphic toxin system
MGLYLCIFEGDEDIDGLEVGSYADYNALRDYVVRGLEEGKAGSRFPTFVMHSDSDGEWSVEECYQLRDELSAIVEAMKTRPPVEFFSEWQRDVAKSVGLVPQNAFECFIDVDGEYLLERLQDLVEKGITKQLPILFQ